MADRELEKGSDQTERVQSSRGELSIRGYELDVVKGPDTGARWEPISDCSTIGTHRSCDFTLSDATVSRFHCELIGDRYRVRVRDLDSSNGTTVDGVAVRDAYLKHGSVIELGRTALRIRHLGQPTRLELSDSTAFGQLVGRSPAMRSTFALLERAAPSDTTILLEGETGTGKSAAARSIHLASPRKNKPFIMVDCSSLPDNLLESELFGHEKGSFTGAYSKRIGAFEEASSGTIFLDEIGEIPIGLQAKLLAAFENREIRPVGANRSKPVDIRIIAATNRDLRCEVNAKRFREDLYYRLAVVKIQVPPLRQRLDDLPLLMRDLLERLGVPDERIESIVTPKLVESLRSSAWPGNIRQLRNYLQQLLLFEDIAPLGFEPGVDRDQTTGFASKIGVDTSVSLSDARQRVLAQFERIYVSELLEAHNGKVSRAAATAHVNRTYFYRLMQRHQIGRKKPADTGDGSSEK